MLKIPFVGMKFILARRQKYANIFISSTKPFFEYNFELFQFLQIWEKKLPCLLKNNKLRCEFMILNRLK